MTEAETKNAPEHSPASNTEGQASQNESADDTPIKTPQRLRQEAIFMAVARTMLLGGVLWAGYYAIWSLTKSTDELQVLAEDTIHDSLQFGATIFLGAELLYYLYVSSSIKRCKEWGMFIWLVGVIVLVLNLRFSV